MAAPRLRLRRGTDNPVTLTDVGEVFETGSATQALVGEPLFTDTNPTYLGLSPVSASAEAGTGTGDFYIADGGSSFVHIGGSSYTARVDSFLVDQDPRDNTGVSEGAKVILEEGGPIGTAETITIKAPVQDAATNSYGMILPVGAPADPGQYLLEYDQATEQLSFVEQVASEQLTTRQVPEDDNATPDEYYLTFVANNNADPGALEFFFTEENLILQPDKDGNAGGTISSLQITGEYVASTGFFSGTGSTDATAVTTNFATEPTGNLLTKTVNIGTGGVNGSAANINIGVTSGTTTINSPIVVGAALVQNVFDSVATTVNAFGAATTSNIAYDGTETSTTNIADGATANTFTNTVNIATNGVAGSTTNVNIGSAEAGTTVFLGTDDNTLGNVETGAVQMDGGLGVAGNASIGGSLDVTTNLIVDGTITNNNATNNTLGDLGTGAVQLAGGLAVSLNTTIGGDLVVEGGDISGDPNNTTNAASIFNDSTGTVNVANAATTVDEYSAATSLDIGYNGTATSTTNIVTGAAANGSTKTVNIGTGAGAGTTNINIGTGGALNSTTNIVFGSTTDQDSTTVTINGNLTVIGEQTVTNINTTNTNVQDALLALNSGMGTGTGALANNTNDVGLFIERGTAEDNAFVGYDEDTDFFVMAYIDSAKTAAGFVTFEGAIVPGDAAETPLDFLPIQVGSLRISDATSRRGDELIAEGASVDDVVIGHLTAAAANTEFSVTDATAGRHLYNVVIDGGSF